MNTMKLYCAADMCGGKVEVFEWDVEEREDSYLVINGNTGLRTIKKSDVGVVRAESLTSYAFSPEHAVELFRESAIRQAEHLENLAKRYRERADMPSALVMVKNNMAVA